MPNRIFVDTAGWWANLFVASKSHHLQAAEWFKQTRQQRQEIVTTNYVLLELVALLTSPLRVPRPKLFEYVDGIRTAPYLYMVHIYQAHTEISSLTEWRKGLSSGSKRRGEPYEQKAGTLTFV